MAPRAHAERESPATVALYLDAHRPLPGLGREDLPPMRHSLAWGMVVDGFKPDRWDVAGVLVCLVGVVVIRYAPRNA